MGVRGGKEEHEQVGAYTWARPRNIEWVAVGKACSGGSHLLVAKVDIFLVSGDSHLRWLSGQGSGNT